MIKEIQERIAAKVILERDRLGLMNIIVAKYLDIHAGEVSSIQREDKYKYVTNRSWNKIHDWYDSGLTLEEWYERMKQMAPIGPAEEPEPISTPTPEVKRTAKPKPEEPTADSVPAPTKQPEAPAPDPKFKYKKETEVIPASIEITKHVFTPEKSKGKRGPKVRVEGKPGTYNKGKPSKQEIERVLATLGVEIEVIVKLKNKQD